MSAYILRNQYGVHPEDESLVEAKAKHILSQHQELLLMPWKMLEKAWAIGEELLDLKDKVFHGQWTPFCESYLSSLSLNKIERYMQLRRNKDRLLEKYKVCTCADFEELPPIRDALADIQAWNREERERQGKPPRKLPPKRKVASKTIEAQATIARTKVSSPQSNAPGEALTNADEPIGPPVDSSTQWVAGFATGMLVNPEVAYVSTPHVAEPPAESESSELTDEEQNELDAAYYFADGLREDAPHVWAKLCPDCQALLEGKVC